MDTTNLLDLMVIELFVFFAFVALVVACDAPLHRASLQLRNAVQWGLICLASGLFVAAIAGVPRFIVEDDKLLVANYIVYAGLMAVHGYELSPPQETEGKLALGSRVSLVLAGVVSVFGFLLGMVGAFNSYDNLDWLVTELWRWN